MFPGECLARIQYKYRFILWMTIILTAIRLAYSVGHYLKREGALVKRLMHIKAFGRCNAIMMAFFVFSGSLSFLGNHIEAEVHARISDDSGAVIRFCGTGL